MPKQSFFKVHIRNIQYHVIGDFESILAVVRGFRNAHYDSQAKSWQISSANLLVLKKMEMQVVKVGETKATVAPLKRKSRNYSWLKKHAGQYY